MSTKKTREALTFWAESCPEAPAGIKAKAALVEMDKADEVRKVLRDMFADGTLDPYPSSDSSPNLILRRWCGYKGGK